MYVCCVWWPVTRGGNEVFCTTKKAAVKARLARGDIDLLVSTQAALWLNGGWSKLALVVVDEQHK
jgi:RecG-like helicase